MKTDSTYTIYLKKLLEYLPLILLFFLLLPAILFSQPIPKDSEKKLTSVSGKEKVDLLNQLADANNRKSIQEESTNTERALRAAREIGYRYGEAVALRNIGFVNYRKNELDTAEQQFKKALEIFLQLKDSFQLSEIYNQIGLLHWRKEQFVLAYKNFRSSLKISKAKRLERQTAQSLNYIGLIYWKWGEYSSALDYFSQALAIKEKLGDNFEIGITLNNIANIYNEINQPGEAIIYANRCLQFAKDYPNKYVLGRALNNLGKSYFKKNDYEKAIAYQNKSLAVKSESVDLLGEAFSFDDLGEVYFAKKDYSRALTYFQKALSLWQTLRDSYGISKTTLNLGKVYAARGLLDKADSSFNKSLLEARANHNKKNIAQSYLALSSLYEAKQDYQRALELHKLYSLASDSLLNTATSDKIAELRVITEIDEKEKEVELLTKEKKIQLLEIEQQHTMNSVFLIVTVSGICILLLLVFRFIKIRSLKILLEKKNKAISQKSEELEEAIAAKDKFFSIIAHDLKSPFTGLLGYSEILAEEFDTMDEEEKVRTVGYIKTLIERVYTLIENLLDWSRIQTSRIEIVPVVLDLSKEVPEILELLNANAGSKQITIINQILSPEFVFVDKYCLKSILQNLISNAIKFTQSLGEISISAKEKIGFIEIYINDNGIGICSELLQKIFNIETRHTTKGTADETGTGLGLLLCKELAEKNGGSIAIESSVGIGTTICVTLPKAKTNLLDSPGEVD
ncbi:MAG: hypothetical protein COZ80_02800 [Ignavibacteria bacterium CG_4_8_14_3_um_filter_37_9]|nr:tetratricopeptide repeat protein [Ignavibacteria bacterium]PIS45200.1 MAG: hypothetical protein COT22_06470 [Ignavibacteria bacterium CG08_land_8_20_14_0_20_37_9]PIW99940.1 MAG: hypothetical protein COZ80_02800 [Ignavibacteria bacterium CG_4_8_14_3_um_filter_37_9]PJC57042.1 MAG: hypothetical protein CO025_15355 [Ignavibacteria bacterium CG_4_9_14_0_2_um_filter_37_13]